MVYESRVAAEHSLWRAPLEGAGAPVKLVDAGGSDLVVSPDSKLFAFRADTGEVEVRSLENGELVRRMPAPADPSALQWTADGSAVLYLCHAAGEAQLWKQPLAAGPPMRLQASLPNDVRSLDWSADRHRIVYLRRQIHVNLALITNLR